MTVNRDTASFDELIQVDAQTLDLAAAALAWCEEIYPALDRRHSLARLDEMAAQAGSGLPATAPALQVLHRLNTYLFQEQGFAGNKEHYGDPRNSYLNEVMDRRLGIPISLCVLYLELAWRLGLHCDGVGFPGHFLVKCTVHGGQAILDPFNAGASLGEEELLSMAAGALGRAQVAREQLTDFLVSVDRPTILGRMLRNLKLIYLQQGQTEQALTVVNHMLALDSNSHTDRLDRARLYESMGAVRAALADYEAYKNLAGDLPGGAQIQARITALRSKVRRLN